MMMWCRLFVPIAVAAAEFRRSVNFTDGQLCGNPDRELITIWVGTQTGDGDEMKCATEVAKNLQCGHVFHFGSRSLPHVSPPRLESVCRCVTFGNRCQAKDPVEGDLLKSWTIYELMGEAGAFTFTAHNRDWWPAHGTVKVYRDGWLVKGHSLDAHYEGPDNMQYLDLFGTWDHVYGKGLVLNWTKYGSDLLQSNDDFISFSNSNNFTLAGDWGTWEHKPPHWFHNHFVIAQQVLAPVV